MISQVLKTVWNVSRIESREKWPPEKLRAHQWSLLKKTLRLAFESIPFYQKRFAQMGLRYEDIRSWEDFKHIPILTKSEIRAAKPADFLPADANVKDLAVSQTTGSSGIPITVYRSQDSQTWDKALIHYGMKKVGVKVTDRVGQVLAILHEKPMAPGPLAKLGIKRNFVVSLKQTDQEIVRELQQIKPQIITSYPSVLLRLSEYLQSEGIRLKVRGMVAQGEVLPEPWREIIEKAFGAPLYHTYGATEFARIGFECTEKHGFHLLADAGIVEVLKDGRQAAPGEEGELIVTNLNNDCMPFIRYQIGDRGVLSPHACPCGIRYPLLANVTGRSDDYLILPSGKRVSARAVTHMQFPGIVQYKMIQKTPAKLEILVIPSESFGQQTIEEIQDVLSDAFLGEKIEVNITRTDSLPVSRTGKLQLVSREF